MEYTLEGRNMPECHVLQSSISKRRTEKCQRKHRLKLEMNFDVNGKEFYPWDQEQMITFLILNVFHRRAKQLETATIWLNKVNHNPGGPVLYYMISNRTVYSLEDCPHHLMRRPVYLGLKEISYIFLFRMFLSNFKKKKSLITKPFHSFAWNSSTKYIVHLFR